MRNIINKFGFILIIILILSMLIFVISTSPYKNNNFKRMNNSEYLRGYENGFNDGFEKGHSSKN